MIRAIALCRNVWRKILLVIIVIGHYSIFCFFSYAAPDKAPTNLTVIKVTADSIQISWQPVPRESLNGKLFGYKIRWKEEKAENYTYQELRIKDPSARRKKRAVNYFDHPPNNFTLRNLTAYTNYSVAIAAATGALEGLGPYSQDVILRSGEGG